MVDKNQKSPLSKKLQYTCFTQILPIITLVAVCDPRINHTLPQIVHILHFCLVNSLSLLHYVPDFVFNWVQISAIRRRKSGVMNAGVWRSRRLIVFRAVFSSCTSKDVSTSREVSKMMSTGVPAPWNSIMTTL